MFINKLFRLLLIIAILNLRSLNVVTQISRPWVFWYWIDAAVSKEGIKTDLETMAKIGIEGAYLMFIKGEKNPPLYQPSAVQFSEYWWDCLKYAFNEAKRLNIKLALHISDGFALAGGPWITPDLSMQKVVFSELFVKGPLRYNDKLPQPEINENFYKDIAIFAIPIDSSYSLTSFSIKPKVISSTGEDISYLVEKGNKQVFRSNEPCWIQFNFEKPFTCRSITIYNNNTNYQSLRLTLQISEDGVIFKDYFKFTPPRHGWQDEGIPSTFSIPEVKTRYFRLVFNPDGSETGAEDLDYAKWRHVLRLTGVEFSGMPRINQYEGKSGRVWRIAEKTSTICIPENLCIPTREIINITDKFKEGKLIWDIPQGYWLILRIGHTSTGKTNATGGGAKGLECDKFNPHAIRLQLNSWFGRIYDTLKKNNIVEPLKILHVDSWECGSQNWSENFPIEFKSRRGYDLIAYLPLFAGIPIENVNFSEKILYDIRRTISDLISEVFFNEVHKFAQQHNCLLSAESVAPVMVSDNLSFYKYVDIPMGEFWFDSPTHDKPADVLDAISASNIYKKKIVAAESFTQLRINWKEHPAILKPIADFYMTQGINSFVFHVFAHNPWIDKKPGMTLDKIGLYFQRDQIWIENGGKAFINYLANCMNILQKGYLVADIAIYIGNEVPSRSLLPHQLYEVVPQLFKNSVQLFEKERNKKVFQIEEKPKGVFHTGGIPILTNYIDPLNGYKYNSINYEALMSAYVKNNKIIIGNNEYSLLIFPGVRKMDPLGNNYAPEIVEKILDLIYNGANIMFINKPEDLKKYNKELFENGITKYGKGLLINMSSNAIDIIEKKLRMKKDFYAIDTKSKNIYDSLSWIHRKTNDSDLYFISNQSKNNLQLKCFFKVKNKKVIIYDPLKDEFFKSKINQHKEYTSIEINLNGNQSLFIIFSQEKLRYNIKLYNKNKIQKEKILNLKWNVKFFNVLNKEEYNVQIVNLTSWTDFNNDDIRYFSGTAKYSSSFYFNDNDKRHRIILDLGEVFNVAELFINGKFVSTLWIKPYEIDITNYLINGENLIEIYITNSWYNRFYRELQSEQQSERIMFITNFVLNEGLEKAGLVGPIKLKYKK